MELMPIGNISKIKFLPDDFILTTNERTEND